MLAIFLNKTIMARPTKQGLDYFPLDVDFFQDLKIRKIIRAYGDSATAILICILCMIYKDNGYHIKWDEDTAFIISEILNSDEEKISLVVSKAIEIDFFNKEVFLKFSILTSRAIQKRFQLIVKNSKLKRSKIEHNLNLLGVNTEEMGKSSEETPITSEESTQSKVKESKEKESKGELHTDEAEIIEVIEVSDYQDTFRENLLRFKKEFPSEKRYEEIAIMFSKKKDEIEMLFDEFIKENEQSRKHDNLIGYDFLTQELKKHFFNWVRAKERNKEEKASKQTNFQILANKVLKETNLNPYQ